MDVWNTSFLLGWPIFRGENVSFRECNRGKDDQRFVRIQPDWCQELYGIVGFKNTSTPWDTSSLEGCDSDLLRCFQVEIDCANWFLQTYPGPPKSNIDTKHGFLKCMSFQTWQFWVSMLVFRRCIYFYFPICFFAFGTSPVVPAACDA